jgi:hypothetical protein
MCVCVCKMTLEMTKREIMKYVHIRYWYVIGCVM